MKEMSRRTFLKTLPFFVAALSAELQGCAPALDRRSQADRALFRSGSLVIENRLGKGQAFLFSENDGYSFYTLQHVADAMRADPFASYVSSPGLFTVRINPENFRYQGSRDYPEFEAKMPIDSLSRNDAVAVLAAITQGKITPLVAASNAPQPREIVAMPRPDTGKLTVMRIGTYDAQARLVSLDPMGGGTICHGRSGSPILRYVNSAPSNQVYGIVQAGDGSKRVFDFNAVAWCYTRAFYHPLSPTRRP